MCLSSLVQIWIVFQEGCYQQWINVKLPKKLLRSWSTFSMAKLGESLTVYLLVVNGSKLDTKNFAGLYVGICKADKIALKGGQPSADFLCTLQEPCIFSGLFPSNFRCLPVFPEMFRVNKLFINLICTFFLTGNKIPEMIIFYTRFLKFALIT